MPILLRCHQGIGPTVSGTALVAADNFSARYDLDRSKGIFSRSSHKLAGQSYDGRILVLDTAKGGVATAWMLHEMTSRGVVPRALIFNRVNPILAQGAALATSRSSTVSRAMSRSSSVPATNFVSILPRGVVEILNRDD